MMRTQHLSQTVVGIGIAALLLGGLAFAQPQPTVSEDRARAAALAAFPGTVREVEIDRYQGRLAYEFKVRPQNGGPSDDVHVDATTGVVLGIGHDTEPDTDNGSRRRGGPDTPAASNSTEPGDAGPPYQDDFNLAGRTLSDTGEGRYFVLRPGFRTVLSDGETTLTITVLNQTREVGGVLTRVVEEREETNGLPAETALNDFAIDTATGDAFYFGEDVDVFQGGQLTGHPGVWLATNGNRPGLIMPGNPVIGMRYYQEVAPDVAMDRAEVLSTTETCTTPAGVFADCLVTRETSAIETFDEQKSYVPGIGLVQDRDLLLVSHGYVDPGP
jgi:hypothetical protein